MTSGVMMATKRHTHGTLAMADQTSLRFIGLAFGAITAAVTLMAAIAVINVDRSLDPPPAAALSTSTG